MKVEIKIRKDNERGLFAIDDIKKGEIVCILPIDYFQLDENWYSTVKQTNKVNFRYGIICEIRQKGNTQYESFTSFLNDKDRHISLFCSCFLGYTKLIGVSNPDTTDDVFIGHMINDYVDMSFLSEQDYQKISTEFSNVKVSSKLKIFKDSIANKRLGLQIKATRDIKKGNELFLSYGPEYWKKYSKKEPFIYVIKLEIMN